MQYPCTLKNNIYHSNRREQPPFFHSDTNTWPCSGPFCWQNPCSGCNSGTDWFAALEYILFQLCSNIEQISYVHKIPKKLCKPPCCGSNQPLSKLHHFFTWYALFKVATFLFLQLFVPNDSAFASPTFFEHTCCSNVVNSKEGKQTKRCEKVIHKYNLSKLTLEVKHSISRRTTFSTNLHLVEEETLECLPILQQ